jgi:hypothetical protein
MFFPFPLLIYSCNYRINDIHLYSVKESVNVKMTITVIYEFRFTFTETATKITHFLQIYLTEYKFVIFGLYSFLATEE